MMTARILEKLMQIEHDFGVKILLAVESGSRAWGFDSPDSDFDVRFIYVHPVDWYLKVLPQSDTIEYMSDDHLLDFSGWELRKALQLLRKTNPNLSDWLLTDKVYLADKDFLHDIRAAQDAHYNPIHGIYHFFNIARKHDEANLIKKGYTLKRFLYFMRGLLACEYIMQHNCHPPVCFVELVEATIVDIRIKDYLYQLLDLKRRSKESDNVVVASELVDYTYTIYHRLLQMLDDFRPVVDLPDASVLDSLLQNCVKGISH